MSVWLESANFDAGKENIELQVSQYFTEINLNTSFSQFVKGLEERAMG